MKLKNIFLILFFVCTSLCFAQDKLVRKIMPIWYNVTICLLSPTKIVRHDPN